MAKTTYGYSMDPSAASFSRVEDNQWHPWVHIEGGAARAILDITRERINQHVEYGEAGDDTLEPAEWIARLAKHLGRAVTLDPAVFRRQLVRVAAICVAAIESFDRRFPE